MFVLSHTLPTRSLKGNTDAFLKSYCWSEKSQFSSLNQKKQDTYGCRQTLKLLEFLCGVFQGWKSGWTLDDMLETA